MSKRTPAKPSPSPAPPPCWLCGTTMRRETWRDYHTGEPFAVVYVCPKCQSTRDTEETP